MSQGLYQRYHMFMLHIISDMV